MKKLLFLFALTSALVLGVAACGDDDDDATVDSDEVTEDGEATEAEIPDPEVAEEEASVEGNSVEDESGDLVELLSLVPASELGVEIPEDVSQAIDIQSASLAIEGSELVLTITVAGEIGLPEDFTRGYDFAFKSEAFTAGERGAYQDSTLVIGAEPSGGTWVVIKKSGPNEPVPLETGTVTVEGATVTIRVPITEVIATTGYEWRAVAWHFLTETTPADTAPNVPGFVNTPLEGAAPAGEATAEPTATP
ncbi:MAG TPA: hypothetical protein VFZ12_01915 [Dehalococcoidia bacterium]|nr:hypothetical protein [Dehalococcoidia bacterium]